LEEAQAQDRQIQRIIAGDYQFYEEDWGHIAPLAKDLIKQLLVVDPDRRLKVSAAREHPWVIAAGQINIGGGGTNSLIPPVRTHPSSLPEPNQEIRFNTAI
jgi:serine/threonine protein kinase